MARATDIVDALHEAATHGDPVTVGELNDEIGRRGTGALIALPAMLEITPIGGIPGLPTVLAAIVILFAGQIALGRADMWLPGFIERRTIAAEKLERAARTVTPVARWLDHRFGNKLHWFVHSPAPRIAALAVVCLALTVPPLEIVPFGSTIPMGAIALFGLALMLGDGVLMLVAWTAFAAAAVGVYTLLT